MYSRLVTLVFALLFTQAQAAEPLRFLVVSKSLDNPFFKEVERGCQQAALDLAVECVFLGPEEADARYQDQVITAALKQPVDGIAVSSINSRLLRSRSIKQAIDLGIPIVTFDSDFDAEFLADSPGIRKTYIGTDNYQFGREIALAAIKQRPQGGRYCLISGHKASANLAERMRGAHDAFNAQKE